MAACAEDQTCAQKLKVLADETRLAVLHLLMDKPRHVGELVEQLNVEQSLMSHHLKVMREAGIVESRRDGKAVLYDVAPSLRPTQSLDVVDLGCCKLSFK